VQYVAVTRDAGAVAEGETVDVIVQLADDDNSTATTDEVPDLRISFCDPDAQGPLGPIGTDTDVDDDGGSESAAIIHGECATDADGRCTIGLSVVDEGFPACDPPYNDGGFGTITAWADDDGDNALDPTEARDVENVSLRQAHCTKIVCTPTDVSRPEGSRVEFQCTAYWFAGMPLAGVVITMDVLSGPNAEETPLSTCTTEGNGGQTPAPQPNPTPSSPTPGACGYNDAGVDTAGSPPGTDLVAFCMQSPAPSGQAGTAGCDPHELQFQGSAVYRVSWVKQDRISCSPEGFYSNPGGSLDISCSVHDPSGRGVPSVTISFTTSGVGTIGSSCQTGPDGSCSVRATSGPNEFGQQHITASLPQGSCYTSDPPLPDARTACTDGLTIHWETEPPPPPDPHCSDGSDNDGDGEIDLHDRGCESAGDDSEAGPFTQEIFMRYRRRAPRGFTGQISSEYPRCQRARVVKIYRRGVGVVGRDRTDRDGSFFVRFPPRRGLYQARVAAKMVTIGDGQTVECLADRSAVIRTSRRR
jgi:hypothetical protein